MTAQRPPASVKGLLVFFAVIIVAAGLYVWLLQPDAPPVHGPERDTFRRSDYGKAWPIRNYDEVKVYCLVSRVNGPSVYMELGGQLYGLNGNAMRGGAKELTDAEYDQTAGPAMKQWRSHALANCNG
ncbi:hypothetical protein [Sinorhizobium fredii]|uniref:hypothetical protein n=1 Tax=Rhizobium fredii TaxID=380 RepID=UPI001295DB18|nr:hypothetical protein [Sinorhizobium fredii]MQW94051.1 hypothetical protein [Sinorhizobium fredii]